MHFSKTVFTFASALLAASVAADPVQNLLPRATDTSACASSYSALYSSVPTPTDKALISWLDAQTAGSVDVPSSLQSAYCTYEHSAANWAKSTAVPFISSCSAYFSTDYSSYLQEAQQFTTTESWCSSVTGNAAYARETGFLPGAVVAAAGLVAAVL